MELTELLRQVRMLRLMLRVNQRNAVVVWSPNTRVPRTTRQAIREHNDELRDLVEQNCIDVCPSQDLHKREWYYAGWQEGQQVYRCGACERLAPYISRKKQRSA
jgi:broad specificity phosphatase PhoE